MNIKHTQAIIEAILFASGEAVKLGELTKILNTTEAELIPIVEQMMEIMNNSDGGLQIIRLADSYQLCTKSEYFSYISMLVTPRVQAGLSNGALETLSIVAYNQPVTRGSIEYIRGVNSDYAVAKLVEKGLVCECGRLNTPGKPLLYKTTDEFLRCFGLKSLDELPDIGNAPLKLTFFDKETEEKNNDS